jgi:hypothetical protein
MALSGQLKLTVPPTALTNTLTTNIYNNASALIYDVFKWMYVCNKTSGAVTFSLWLGLTGANTAGTELYNAVSVPANTTSAFYMGNMKVVTTQFLVGGASANASLTITITGEQVVV